MEAFCRTIAGISPWINLGIGSGGKEGILRKKMGDLSRELLINITDPTDSKYFLNFGSKKCDEQALVESAYLAQGLLRAPRVLWDPLSTKQRRNVLASLLRSRGLLSDNYSRKIKNGNWQLMPALVEACIWKYGSNDTLWEQVDFVRLESGVMAFNDFYFLGHGVYGDGKDFVSNYYNSYVIHSALLDVSQVACEKRNSQEGKGNLCSYFPAILQRAQQYAGYLERLISPEGTYPALGRSSGYRFAAFQTLSHVLLLDKLPSSISYGAARSALVAVIRRQIEAPGTFNANDGLLNIGFVGYQPSVRMFYNTPGSFYACLTGLLLLGTNESHPLWTAPAEDWSQKKIWSGQNVELDLM